MMRPLSTEHVITPCDCDAPIVAPRFTATIHEGHMSAACRRCRKSFTMKKNGEEQ